MNQMHFEGIILEAGLHKNSDGRDSFIMFRVQVNVNEVEQFEEVGSIEQLSKRFEFSIDEGTGNILNRECQILRNASGYQFVKYL